MLLLLLLLQAAQAGCLLLIGRPLLRLHVSAGGWRPACQQSRIYQDVGTMCRRSVIVVPRDVDLLVRPEAARSLQLHLVLPALDGERPLHQAVDEPRPRLLLSRKLQLRTWRAT